MGSKIFSSRKKVLTMIGLGFLGAVGVTLLFLGCGLYHNWWPLLAMCMFITVPIPIVLCPSETNRLANDWSFFLVGTFAALSFGTLFLLAQYGNVKKHAFTLTFILFFFCNII